MLQHFALLVIRFPRRHLILAFLTERSIKHVKRKLHGFGVVWLGLLRPARQG
jgi:hypothetical protein